jgi:hypothetical protein
MTSASTAPSTVSNVGPLTTTFTPPAACLPSTSGWYCYSSSTTWTATCVWGLSCGSSSATIEQTWTLLTECFPSFSLLNFATVGPLFGHLLETRIVYSPGLICPQGYTTALKQIGPKGTYWTEILTFPTEILSLQTFSTYTSLPNQPFVTVPTALPVTLESVPPGETAVVCCPR